MSTAGLPAPLRSLLRPDAYPHPVTRVDLVETNVSWVLLTGELAYKIKRPVHLPFVDLRDPERRAFFCAEEIRLNRRFAPELYLDVCEVVAADGGARIGGAGPVLDHAVRMRQFPREQELDRLLASGKVEPAELWAFGHELAGIHAELPRAAPGDPWGKPTEVRAAVLENFRQGVEAAAAVGNAGEIGALAGPLAARLSEADPWLLARLREGRAHECHGDLHTANVVRLGERLVAFDSMEFEPAFRWIDVAEEVAFLSTDLEGRGAPDHAHAFVSGYLENSGDHGIFRVLRLYQAHGALVRAKVAALRAAESGADGEHARCVAQAGRALEPRQPRLILMCGVSGSGKTWLAQRLAPRLRAIHLRSDLERRRLAEPRPYTPRARALTYVHLAICAEDVLSAGIPVLLDATFLRREHRTLFRKLAAELHVPLRVVACRAPAEVLRERVASRLATGSDASQADLAVLAEQEASQEAITPEEGLSVLDADTRRARVVEEVVERLAGD